MNDSKEQQEVMTNLHTIEVENRALEKIYPVILRATYSSRTDHYTVRLTDQKDATTEFGAISSNSHESVMAMLKSDLEILFGDQKLERNTGDPDYARAASISLGFAHDHLISIKSSCSNIDTAIIETENAIQEIKKYFEWADVPEDI